MWAYLEHLSEVLENIHRVLKDLPDADQEYIREGLTPRARSLSASMKMRPPKRRPRSHHSVPFVTGEDGQLVPGEVTVRV